MMLPEYRAQSRRPTLINHPYVLLALVALSLAQPACDGWPDYFHGYTAVQVTDSVTGAAVAGADVFAANVGGGLPPIDKRRQFPTDVDGRTLVLVSAVEGRQYEVVLGITIIHEGREETLLVPNYDGVSVEGDDFAVLVLDTDAPAPPPPDLRAIAGSNPPTLEVNSVVDVIGVCSNATGERIWAVGPNVEYTVGSLYVESTVVGVVPDGDIDFTFNRVEVNGEVVLVNAPCPFSVKGLPVEGFTPFSSQPFENVYTQSESYCLDASGAVVACDE